MKKIILGLVWLVCGSLVSLAQTAPTAFGNFIAYKTATIGLVTHGQSITIYSADGTSTHLYGESHVPGVLPYDYVGQLPSVPFAYLLLDGGHGTLTVQGTTPSTLTFSSSARATTSDFESVTDFVQFTGREEMVNTSARVSLAAGKSAMVGFVIQGTRNRWVLVRAVGPGLRTYGVAAPLADPQLQLFGSDGQSYGTSGSWRTSAVPQSALTGIMAFVGAFPLATDSDDSVLFVQLKPGIYSAVGTSVSSTGQGDVLTEVYILP